MQYYYRITVFSLDMHLIRQYYEFLHADVCLKYNAHVFFEKGG